MLRITNLTNPSQIKADYKIHSTTFATKKDEQQSNIILKQNRHWPSYVEISLLPPENKKRVLQNLCKTSTRVWRLCLGPRTPIRKIIYLTWRKFRKNNPRRHLSPATMDVHMVVQSGIWLYWNWNDPPLQSGERKLTENYSQSQTTNY